MSMRGFAEIWASIFLAVVVGLLVWAVMVQNQAYDQRKAFIKECGEKGGWVTEVASGWVHVTLQCAGITTTTNQ